MNERDRRDPDELLSELKRHEARAHRGKLKIFFGASAGVGKTYSMLESARNARASGVDVVVGYVEQHGRRDTEKLLEGLEQLPFLEVRYRGMIRREFDLDAALKRAPGLILVDELAHSNIAEGEPKLRHAKRWQDIEELLAAGITVWTTVNVQHLESLNDVVAGITGIRQQETIPDAIFDEADDVELIDLSPGELIARLKAGKVYLSEHVGTATAKFFREPNLLALREMALRRTADRVDAAARAYGNSDRASKPWLARDRFLIAVAPDDQAEQLVRVGKRFADALDAEWLVVSVETPAMLKLGERARNRRINVLRLAESLGAQTVTLDGPSASAALTEYARLRNVTRIVIGEPRRFGLRAAFKPSTATKLVKSGGGFDLSVIARRQPAQDRPERPERVVPRDIRWYRYWAALAISAACTAVAAGMYPYFSLTNLVMTYLLGATIAALRLGRGPASFAAVVNIMAFDFFFVPPRFTLAVSDIQYVVTFAVMLAVALIIANLVASVRAQTRVAGARERRTALLYGMSRELTATQSVEDLALVAVKHVAETFSGRAVVLVPGANDRLHYPTSPPISGSLVAADLSVSQWVFDHAAPAGLGTDTLPAAAAQYLPLMSGGRTLGVLAVQPTQRRRLMLPEQHHLLETFAAQIALALERAELSARAEASRLVAETDSLRSTLLASISQDLTSPLASIGTACRTLNDLSLPLDAPARRDLVASIASKARDMTGIVSNVLDLMRFRTGGIVLHRDWQDIHDLVAPSVAAFEARFADYPITLDLPDDLPPVYIDAALIAHVISNLLENVAKHTPSGTSVIISASAEEPFMYLYVDDSGPGFLMENPERLFAKFQREATDAKKGGAGLGLALCYEVIVAHGGTISALNRPGGGARFAFTLPTVDLSAIK